MRGSGPQCWVLPFGMKSDPNEIGINSYSLGGQPGKLNRYIVAGYLKY